MKAFGVVLATRRKGKEATSNTEPEETGAEPCVSRCACALMCGDTCVYMRWHVCVHACVCVGTWHARLREG